jgi:hypothetical protein
MFGGDGDWSHDPPLKIKDYCVENGIDYDGDILHFVPGAQFYVSSDVIKRRPKEFYEKLWNTVNYDMCPIEAYILERLWHKIFS